LQLIALQFFKDSSDSELNEKSSKKGRQFLIFRHI
jgi:hypothetical protein